MQDGRGSIRGLALREVGRAHSAGMASRPTPAITQPDTSPAPIAPRLEEQGLVARVRAGDPSALEVIFRQYGEPLLRFATRQLGSPEAAEDVVQEVFLGVWRARSGLVLRGSLTTYLFQAVRHRIANRGADARREARTLSISALHDLHSTGTLSPEEVLAGEELSGLLLRVTESLSPRTREVFTLSRDLGMTYAEIAAVLGVSVKAVEMHVGRALAAFRRALTRWDT